MATYLVTGGAGFIGSNFIHYLLWKYKDALVVNVDSLTYASNPTSLEDVFRSRRYAFEQADICDAKAMDRIFTKYGPDFVVNFAAESNVDRSFSTPELFRHTNEEGTLTLLEVASHDWEEPDGTYGEHCFLQVSTDEVYGSIPQGSASERDALAPGNPYAASKAAAEMHASAFANTHGFPLVTARSSNNYGPFQTPDKFVAKAIACAAKGEDIPVYGDGSQMRDWLYVADNCRGLDLVLHNGTLGGVYNIGSGRQLDNNTVAALVAQEVQVQTNGAAGNVRALHVEDRPGHDQCYAMTSAKISSELGWQPLVSFEEGLQKTVAWYLANPAWLDMEPAASAVQQPHEEPQPAPKKGRRFLKKRSK